MKISPPQREPLSSVISRHHRIEKEVKIAT
jgi:hypothetical protein